MDDYQKHYVYFLVDPPSEEIIYVGMGTGSRAWFHGSTQRPGGLSEHLSKLLKKGYIPSDWVDIQARNLSKEAASEMEKRFIDEVKPRFNRDMGRGNLKVTEEFASRMKSLRKAGLIYKEIGEKLGFSTMTVWRTLNGRNKYVNG